MFRLNDWRYFLLTLAIFLCCLNTANAEDSKYYSYHTIDVKPTGSGKVYSTTKTDNGANTNFNACVDPPYQQTWHTGNATNTLYLLAKPNEGYVFSHWEDQDGKIVSNTNPGQVQARCAQNNSDSGPGDYNGTYYAIFLPTQPVQVYTENADFGTASISNAQNEVGQSITITAHENLFQHAFVGWRKEANGQIVSTENPYTFTITEENKGRYYAVFRDDYYFYRVKNYATNRYMVAKNDQGNISDLSSFSLINGIDNVVYDAGAIVQVRIHYAETTAKTREYAIIVQGEDTQEETGAYLRMDRIEANELTLWEPNAEGIRARDNGGESVNLGLTQSADNTKWIFEKLDLDLNGDSYFSLDPNKLKQVDGKFYTTLRTSWNILFNPGQMTPYVVTSVDETSGTFDMEPITGNIIPAGTPVIIETKSDDIEENRMVPTKTAAANGAVPAGNLLQVSTKYFPNQPAPVSNCKQLMVKDGLLTFGGDALNSVNGNEAYLSVSNDVSKIQKVTLAKLVADGVPGRNYVITDLIGIAEVNDKDNHDHMIICKDSNGYAAKDVKTDDGWIDYIHEVSELDVPDVYDQSNWIALHLPTGDEITSDFLNGAQLKGVKGRLISKENPEFMLDAVPTCDGDKVAFTANTYIAASFYGDNHQPGYGGKKQFFFVQPKPMEYATVTWSQWDGDGEKFVVPNSDDHPEWNQADLEGQFDYNGNYLEQDPVKLQSGHTYEMKAAVIKYKTATGGTQARAPRHAEGASKQYVVYPLTITRITQEQNGVITGVQQLSGDRQVMHVDYYNVSGMRSERPWQGVNIVVTRYSDGTTSAVKMLR